MSVVSRPCFSNSPASFMIHGTACEPAMALQPKTSLSAALEEPGRESRSNRPKTTGRGQYNVIRFGRELVKQSIFIIVCSKWKISVGQTEWLYSMVVNFTRPNVCRHRYRLSLRSRRESPGSQGF